MTDYGSLRASDADRETVTARLRDAASEGRLEPEELEERVEAALHARTYGELSRLLADLPYEPGRPQRRAGSRAGPLVRFTLFGAAALTAVMVALAVLAVIALVALAAAAWWVACLVVWVACCRTRRRFAASSIRRARAGRMRRTRPAGLL